MFIVYKTTNRITSEYYIGVHKTVDPIFDGYFGSGRRILRSVKKYGKDNFVRTTLYEYDDPDEKLAFDKEQEILCHLLNDPLCLNLGPGGKGGSNFKGHKHREDTKQLLRDKAKHRLPTEVTEEHKEKARSSRLAKNNGSWFSPESLEKIAQKSNKDGKPEVREQISQTLSRYYAIEENRIRQSQILKKAYSNPEIRQKHKIAMQGNNKNKLWMVNNETRHRTRIDPSQKEEYISKGYIEGYKFNAG